MEYKNWKELYIENRSLIDFEFKNRLYDVLNKLLQKIDYFQNEEHKEIDGGEPYSVNQPHRDNIEKLEKFYRPLYNYINTVSLPLMEQHKTYLDKIRHEFVDLVFPELTEDGINKMRGKPHWYEDYVRTCRRAYDLSQMLEAIFRYSYELGATNIDAEPEDKYNQKEFSWDEGTFYEKVRKLHLSRMQSYGKNTIFGKMLASIVDMGTRMGYDQAIKDGLSEEEAHKKSYDVGMQQGIDFLKQCFKTEDNDSQNDNQK
jgi:hypothetical protein